MLPRVTKPASNEIIVISSPKPSIKSATSQKQTTQPVNYIVPKNNLPSCCNLDETFLSKTAPTVPAIKSAIHSTVTIILTHFPSPNDHSSSTYLALPPPSHYDTSPQEIPTQKISLSSHDAKTQALDPIVPFRVQVQSLFNTGAAGRLFDGGGEQPATINSLQCPNAIERKLLKPGKCKNEVNTLEL